MTAHHAFSVLQIVSTYLLPVFFPSVQTNIKHAQAYSLYCSYYTIYVSFWHQGECGLISLLHVCRSTPPYKEGQQSLFQVSLCPRIGLQLGPWEIKHYTPGSKSLRPLLPCFMLSFVTQNWKDSVCGIRGTADWFGVSKDGDATQKWQRKSLRHCSLRYGKLKPQVMREMDLPSQDNISLTSTETPPPLYVSSSQHGMQKVRKYCYSH